MFERQIEDALAQLTRQTIGDNDVVLLKTILASPVPASVKRVFTSEAERWRDEEMKRLLDSAHFDYSDEQVRKYFDTIASVAMEHTRFTREEFSTTLDATVKLLFNYVCRPQWTLVKYIFADAPVIPTHVVLEKMRHFTDYEYYAAVMQDYTRTKQLDTLAKDRFEEFLTLIDGEVVRNLDSNKLARLSQPIFNVFNPGDDPEYSRVPIEALSIFYDDKNITSVANRLESEKEHSPTMSMHDLIMLVGETDYTAGVEISEIVTRHLGRPMVEPGDIGDIEDIDAELSGQNVVIPIGELPETSLDAYMEEAVPDLVPNFEMPSETEAISGEQETPDFSLFEDETPAVEKPTTDEFNLPENIFIEQEQTKPSIEISADLNKTLAGLPSQEPSLDDDDFLKQLDLTDDDFKTPSPAAAEIAIPDIDLSAMEPVHMPVVHMPAETQIVDTVQTHDGAILPPGATVVADEPFAPTESAAEPKASPQDIIATLGDLRTLIDANNKKQYIRKLFNRDDKAYESAIDALNGRATWREASEYIDEVFLKFNIDMYSRVAVTFTDDVYRRYQKKK